MNFFNKIVLFDITPVVEFREERFWLLRRWNIVGKTSIFDYLWKKQDPCSPWILWLATPDLCRCPIGHHLAQRGKSSEIRRSGGKLHMCLISRAQVPFSSG